MAMPNKAGEIVKITLPEDKNKPEDERTHFLIKVLHLDKQRELKAKLVKADEKNDKEVIEATIGKRGSLACLMGWENFKEGGQELPFDAATFLDHLSSFQVDYIAGEIVKLNLLQRDDQKN
jgi:hypothetical protein